MSQAMTPEILLFLVSLGLVHGAQMAGEDGLCLKVEELGMLGGNTYYCKDPELPLCCQTDNTHKCCESEEEKTINDQVLLWGFVALTFVAFGVMICLLTRQGDVWESETLRLAAYNMTSKVGLKNLAEKIKKAKRKNGGEFDDIDRKGNESRQTTHNELQKMPLAWF